MQIFNIVPVEISDFFQTQLIHTFIASINSGSATSRQIRSCRAQWLPALPFPSRLILSGQKYISESDKKPCRQLPDTWFYLCNLNMGTIWVLLFLREHFVLKFQIRNKNRKDSVQKVRNPWHVRPKMIARVVCITQECLLLCIYEDGRPMCANVFP